MRPSLKEAMAREVADWHHRGLIDKELADRLQSRYDKRGAVFSTLLRWLGFFAVSSLASVVMAFLAGLFESFLLGALILLAAAYGLFHRGRKLAIDPQGRQPYTASLLLALSIVAVYGVAALLLTGIYDSPSASAFALTLYVPAAAGFAAAYMYRLRAPLLIALLFLFHAFGSWHQYAGRGTYVFDIQDPRVMAIISGLTVAFGVYHERILEERKKELSGFGHFYAIVGLIYFNISLLILSVFPGGLEWILVLTLGSLAEIVAGARLKDGRLTGFGVVFMSINLYTRYFETFWQELPAGVFFLAAGLAGMGLGYLFELQHARGRNAEAA